MTEARVALYHGEPALMIDGKAYPPMMVTCTPEKKDYLAALGKAGTRLFILETATQAHSETGIADTIADIENVIEMVPDAYILLRISVSPNVEWVESHPDDMVTYNDGSHKQTICTSVSGKPITGMFSMSSRTWQKDEDEVLKVYVEELAKEPLFDRVAGFFLCSGGTSEWYYPDTPTIDYKNNRYADFSPAFRSFYTDFLKERYGTVENLRRAWKRDDATFENPIIPTPQDSQHIWKAHEAIIYGLENWERAGYTVGVTIDMNGRGESNKGIFLNAEGYRHVADFYDAWNMGTARSLIHFAKTLKTLLPNRLIGAFYGALGCTEVYETGTATGTVEVLDSGYVDFLSAPATYNNREAGGVAAQREMQDSFRIRGKMYICEEDTRTHVPHNLDRDLMQVYTPELTCRVLKRDFARNLLEDINGWWYDMAGRGKDHWYDDPDILSLFTRQYEVAEYAYSLDRKKKNEIALITSLEAIHYVANEIDRTLFDHYRTSDLHRIGAPFDSYYASDLFRDDMPDYKLYIMLNVYVLNDAEREAIEKKARRNHAVVLWLYAPGYIDPDGKDVQSAANIEKTTGIHVTEKDETFLPYFMLEEDKMSLPALHYADSRRMYGCIDRSVHSNGWLRPSELNVAYLNPFFAIDDENVTVLGRFGQYGDVAYVQKERDGYTVLYAATQTLRSDLLASAAYLAGCHLFIETDDILFANENFVCVHASSNGKKTIRFKEACSPFEVYEKRFYGENVTSIEVDMKTGDTLMFSTKGAC